MREIRFHLIERIKTKTFLQGLKFYAGYGLRNIFQTGKNHNEELLTEEMTEEKIVENFHKLYYENGERTMYNTYWMGKRVVKSPLDLWIYQEIFFKIKPDLIIETGTRHGGSALFFANMCDLLDKGKIISVDIHRDDEIPEHDRITYMTGSSVDPKLIQNIKKIIEEMTKKEPLNVIVILDSDHTKKHVLNEMELYSDLVSKGSYLIVEDTNVNGYPVEPNYGDGPMEAVNDYLSNNDDFEVDNDMEKFFFTMNPHGFLKKRS